MKTVNEALHRIVGAPGELCVTLSQSIIKKFCQLLDIMISSTIYS